MIYLNIATTALVAILLIGFFVGFFRGWKKSLVRLSILIGTILAAVFLSPLISKSLIKKFVRGTVFTGFGLNIDIESIARDILNDDAFIADLFTAEATTTELAKAILNVGMNIISFLILFFAVLILGLIIYWIVCLVLKVKAKKANIVVDKDKKYWWLKVLGGGIGFLGAFALCIVLLSPVFGVMNICNGFVEPQKQTTAKAVSPQNLVCGELYYTKAEEEDSAKSYIDKYAKLKNSFDKSFLGGFTKYTGMNALGVATFNKLTNVESGGLQVNLTHELVALIKTYNMYKEVFVENEFNLADNGDLDDAMKIYNMANESEIVKSYIQELVPGFANRWSNGQKFLGIGMPVTGEFEDIAKDMIEVFNTSDLNRIDRNIKALVKTVKVANNNGLVKSVQEKKNLIDFLKDNDTFVKQEVLVLSSTTELKHMLPKLVNDFTKVAYKEIVGEDGVFEDNVLTNAQIASINWNNEAEILQNITNKVVEIYEETNNNNDSSVMLYQLTNIGEVIDYSRESVLLSGPFETFIDGFVASKHFKLNEGIQTTIRDSLKENWSSETYKYASLFGVLQEGAIIADNMNKNNGELKLEDLSGVLDEIVSNGNVEDMKQTLQAIVNSDAVGELVGDNESGNILTDVLNAYLDPTTGTTEETLDADIKAGQEIVNIANASISGEGLVLEGTTDEEKKADAKQKIEAIAGSGVMMDLLEDASNDESSSLKGVVDDLGGDVDILKSSIKDSNISDEDKAVLSKLFGVS